MRAMTRELLAAVALLGLWTATAPAQGIDIGYVVVTDSTETFAPFATTEWFGDVGLPISVAMDYDGLWTHGTYSLHAAAENSWTTDFKIDMAFTFTPTNGLPAWTTTYSELGFGWQGNWSEIVSHVNPLNTELSNNLITAVYVKLWQKKTVNGVSTWHEIDTDAITITYNGW